MLQLLRLLQLKNLSLMNNYRYQLQTYSGMSSRFQCPQCQKNRIFILYIDTETNEPISIEVGRCNREVKCGYHYTPKQYFQDKNISVDAYKNNTYKFQNKKNIIIEQKSTSYITNEVFNQSLQQYKNNHFVIYLNKIFGKEITNKLIETYFIGTSKHFNGATVFWQIDNSGKIRTGKIIQYNSTTGKRSKLYWVHTAIKQPDFNLKQCLFGEHLLKYEPSKIVAIVESEKTAIISSIYFSQFIWLACGSLNGLNIEKCKILKDRKVILFPDIKGFDKWNKKITEIPSLSKCNISDLLEIQATEIERENVLDLADFLIKYDYKTFPLSESQTIPSKTKIKLDEVKTLINTNSQVPNLSFETPFEKIKSQNWDNEITELEEFFKNKSFYHIPLLLNPFSKITNIPQFIESHLIVVKLNNGKPVFSPYLNRLQQLKQLILK